MPPDPNAAVATLAAEVGLTLPPEYVAFLDGLPARPRLFPDDPGPQLGHGEHHWYPLTRDGLLRPVKTARRATLPAARQLANDAAMLEHPDPATRAELVACLTDAGFTPERLARGFTVGDTHGDPVFVDPDSGEVCVYRHDGMDVEPLAGSLAELVAGSADVTADD